MPKEILSALLFVFGILFQAFPFVRRDEDFKEKLLLTFLGPILMVVIVGIVLIKDFLRAPLQIIIANLILIYGLILVIAIYTMYKKELIQEISSENILINFIVLLYLLSISNIGMKLNVFIIAISLGICFYALLGDLHKIKMWKSGKVLIYIWNALIIIFVGYMDFPIFKIYIEKNVLPSLGEFFIIGMFLMYMLSYVLSIVFLLDTEHPSELKEHADFLSGRFIIDGINLRFILLGMFAGIIFVGNYFLHIVEPILVVNLYLAGMVVLPLFFEKWVLSARGNR